MPIKSLASSVIIFDAVGVPGVKQRHLVVACDVITACPYWLYHSGARW